MQTPSPLFRQTALEARDRETLGRIVLVRPVSFGIYCGITLAVTLALVGFFVRGQYTQHETLFGQLVPARGIVEVRAPQPGTIVQRSVEEGSVVASGDVLYVVSSERVSRAHGPIHDSVARQLDIRRRSLMQQIEHTDLSAESGNAALKRRIAALESDLDELAELLLAERERVALAEDSHARHARLESQGFIPGEALLAKRAEMLDRRSRLKHLERERSQALAELGELKNRLVDLPLEHRIRIAELERAVAMVEQEMAENAARRSIVIAAPADGVATAVMGSVGQAVDGGRALVSIVPLDSPLQAELYAPSRAIGFVAPGDEVRLRYRAYPYQKFGHHRGTVATISRKPLSAGELPMSQASAPTASREPLYQIVVRLDTQSIRIDGEPRGLRAGMLVEADILRETRRLYEWILEPLRTVTGKLH